MCDCDTTVHRLSPSMQSHMVWLLVVRERIYHNSNNTFYCFMPTNTNICDDTFSCLCTIPQKTIFVRGQFEFHKKPSSSFRLVRSRMQYLLTQYLLKKYLLAQYLLTQYLLAQYLLRNTVGVGCVP